MTDLVLGFSANVVKAAYAFGLAVLLFVLIAAFGFCLFLGFMHTVAYFFGSVPEFFYWAAQYVH